MTTTITSRQNKIIQQYKKLAKHTDGDIFLCDGVKLLDDAIKSNAEIVSVLADEKFPLEQYNLKCNIYKTTYDIISSISPSKTSQGVLFLSREPEKLSLDATKGKYLLLDTIQDPGNVGSILRSVEAFGLSGVYLYGECADPFSPKAIRAGMGAQFRLPVCVCKTLPQNLKIYATGMSENSLLVDDITDDNFIVALGNEGRGLSDEFRDYPCCTIPMYGKANSLGVAVCAGIVSYIISNKYSRFGK